MKRLIIYLSLRSRNHTMDVINKSEYFLDVVWHVRKGRAEIKISTNGA